MAKVDWTKLPEVLFRMISLRSFSAVEFKRFRSICTTWRSSVSISDYPISSRILIKLNPLIFTISTLLGPEQLQNLELRAFLSRASFFRVTPSSSSSQGWLIKSDVDINLGTLHLLNPLSRLSLNQWDETLDLLKFTVTEIGEACLVKKLSSKKTVSGFKKMVLTANHRVLVVCCYGKIRYWSGGIWTRIKDQMGQLCDIIVHNKLTYALDLKGIIWWISSSLKIFRYGPALDENITNSCSKDMSLVGCCGELYIVDRLLEDNVRKKKDIDHDYVTHDDVGNTRYNMRERRYPKTTLSFKVYKMDEEMNKWIATKYLEDNAFVMATDTCFSVLAHEFYGCSPNSIYFTDKTKKRLKCSKTKQKKSLKCSS